MTYRTGRRATGTVIAIAVASAAMAFAELCDDRQSTETLSVASVLGEDPVDVSTDDPAFEPLELSILNPAANCASLIGQQIPASAIALPTHGAIIGGAVPMPDTGSGAFCQVTGAVQATSPLDPAILFQVNLPTNWNQKALHYGGSGFNGTVPKTTQNPTLLADDAPTPLSRGYVTFGGDSGHQGIVLDGSFGLNQQALLNYSGEAVKRTRDVAMAVSQLYYGTLPRLTYFMGGSKGGQEALVAAQRYGADYNGIVAASPATQLPAMTINWQRMFDAAHRPGAYMNDAKQALLTTAVMGACDALDGLKDNVVANLKVCNASFDVRSLRCPNGVDAGDTCLSDMQIDALKQATMPMQFGYMMASGVTSDGPFPALSGADNGDLFGLEPLGLAGGYSALSDPFIRFMVEQNPLAITRGFDHRPWQTRMQYLSAIFDAANPNLDQFRKKGGKLIVVQGTIDMATPASSTTSYVQKVRQLYGGSVKSFLRYYLQPGYGHGTGEYSLRWDALAALDDWVTKGKAPVAPVGTSGSRSMPLCEEPAWPKYMGGDPAAAASFTCVTS